jgi:DNA-binding Lrp family transcriptional regulator
MNNKRKVELEESLSNALEPPRKRQVARLDSILKDYIDPRDIAALPRERHLPEDEAALAHHTRVVTTFTETQDSKALQANNKEEISLVDHTRVASDTSQVQLTTLAHHTTVASDTTLASNQGEPWHDTRVEPDATLAQETRVAQYSILETEYTKTPNDLWDVIMPTLDAYDQSVLWQLYRLSRGYHRDTCTIGFPRLATRCNISPKQVQISVGRLEKRGLIKRVGSDFSNRNIANRGNIYEILLPEGKEAQRARVARHARVEQQATVVPGTSMKLNTQNKNTQTQDSVSVNSRFTLEECRRYANHLKQTGQGITNPGGYATKIFRSGEADAFIQTFLSPQATPDINKCPVCRGSNFVYIDASNPDRGVKPCKHDGLPNQSAPDDFKSK